VNATPTDLPEILLIQPKVFGDERGFFLETWNERDFAGFGIFAHFVQDNHSRSAKGVLRGIHYQIQQPQAKLLRVVAGQIFDVVVDIRKSSATFGKFVTLNLSSSDKTMLWIPIGFAHGFFVVSEFAEVLYKTSDFYAPEYERSIAWNDPDLAIPWPIEGTPTLSKKDSNNVCLRDAELFP
jgi:dTDP-4-dehydrorhamnose 3,5-epimerase